MFFYQNNSRQIYFQMLRQIEYKFKLIFTKKKIGKEEISAMDIPSIGQTQSSHT